MSRHWDEPIRQNVGKNIRTPNGCSLPHTDSEVEALVQRLINEDKGRQDALLNLAFQFEDSCAEKYSGRTHGGIGCSSSQANCPLTEKELHQLRMDEEALKEILEEVLESKKFRSGGLAAATVGIPASICFAAVGTRFNTYASYPKPRKQEEKREDEIERE
ncbi:hypothetical protein Tco_0890204 [Tanacetum coccineum]|uniref:Uncharacterized protein n=1 Tax=Tanacetum coccineum TaxID=301880 RepID=A0ABQ5C2E3_9ASTR